MKYYKVLTKDMCSPYDNKTEWALGETTKLCNKHPLKLRWNGLHLYTSLNNVSIGYFGSRVFEAEPIGEILKDENKICCKEVKLIRELNPSEVTDSEWVYEYCRDVEDIPRVRKNITDSEWAYQYCRVVKDRPSVRKHITDSEWAYMYCRFIEDSPEVRNRITDSYWACRYCRDIKDRPEVRKNITDSEWAYRYCRDVKDRPSVRKHIRSNK